MPGIWFWSEQEIADLRLQLDRIERKIDKLLVGQAQGKELIMSEQEEIDNLVKEVQANRDVVQSATTALNGLVTTVADLTKELNDAIAASTDVSPQIKAAAEALQTNTEMLEAAVPQLAQAVGANTKK